MSRQIRPAQAGVSKCGEEEQQGRPLELRRQDGPAPVTASARRSARRQGMQRGAPLIGHRVARERATRRLMKTWAPNHGPGVQMGAHRPVGSSGGRVVGPDQLPATVLMRAIISSTARSVVHFSLTTRFTALAQTFSLLSCAKRKFFVISNGVVPFMNWL
jgi:hypothetical protein